MIGAIVGVLLFVLALVIQEWGPRVQKRFSGKRAATMPTETPNPGSHAAISAGCRCPVLDNGHGQGAYDAGDGRGPQFWIAQNCPLHGTQRPKNSPKADP